MFERRVVITGLGTVNPIGDNVSEYWEAVLKKENGIGKITKFDVNGLPVQIAGELKDFDPLKRLTKKEIKRHDLFTVYALYATQEAIEDSGFLEKGFQKDRIGVLVASGIGGILTLEKEKEKMMNLGPERVSPFLVPAMIPNIASGVIAIKYGFMGPNFCISSACASSAHAIGEAYWIVKRGDADIMITGGTEAPITPLAVAGFSNMKALSTRNDEPEKASRPFDAGRDGFVMAEGAAIVILEELEHALKRGAKIYGELVGYGATADAYHITAPCEDGEGAYLAMKKALESAGVAPDEVDYINAHGTSTKANDRMETIAIKRLFGERAYKIPISSTKSMIGHLLGAAGAVEFIVTVLSVKNNKIHATRNYENKDPECDLDYVPDGPRELEVNYALTNSFGFGGHNASLLVKKFEN